MKEKEKEDEKEMKYLLFTTGNNREEELYYNQFRFVSKLCFCPLYSISLLTGHVSLG